jgi:xylulokinase
VELYNTDGSQGAARGAGIGAGIYKSQEDAFAGLKPVKIIEPNEKLASVYEKAYDRWENVLKQQLEA